MTYQDQLKSPLWQRKRLDILNKYDFQCNICYSRDKTVVVHHKYYSTRLKAWEYPDSCYICLCEDCHKEFHSWETLYKNNQMPAYLYRMTEKGASITDNYIFIRSILKFFIECSPTQYLELIKQIESFTIKKHQI